MCLYDSSAPKPVLIPKPWRSKKQGGGGFIFLPEALLKPFECLWITLAVMLFGGTSAFAILIFLSSSL